MATNITLALTTFNRPEMTLKAIEKVKDDKRIDEILVVDDHSEFHHFERLHELLEPIKRVTLIRNDQNLGCYHNKRKAVMSADNDWVILFDSDNIIDPSYIDSVLSQDLEANVIYAPDFARPHFNYTGFANKTISASNVANFIKQKPFDCLINTCNYFVNKAFYLSVWKDHKEPWTADTLFHNYNHLKAGGYIQVVRGLQYDHLVHNKSHYKEHVSKTGDMFNEYLNKMKRL